MDSYSLLDLFGFDVCIEKINRTTPKTHNMPRLIAFLLAISCSFISFAQSFEGKVVYTNIYKSKIPNVSDEQLTAMMGSQYDYFMKGGDYKVESNGNLFLWQVYLSKDNKIYTKMANSETVLWNDGATNTDEIIKMELNKNATTILGYACDELVLTCSSGVQKYYFSNKFFIDPKLFTGHNYGNWLAYVSRSSALPLKSIIDNAQFTWENVATSVTPMKLENSFFVLPPNTETAPSPY